MTLQQGPECFEFAFFEPKSKALNSELERGPVTEKQASSKIGR